MEITKQKQYAEQKIRLKRAISGGYFYEAIVIEYAMFEDRSASVLEHVGCKTTSKNGRPLRLTDKLKAISNHPSFQSPYIKKRLSNELLEQIWSWKFSRDKLIHDMMNPSNEYTFEAKRIAEEGNEILRVFDNKVRSVNDFLRRKSEVDK